MQPQLKSLLPILTAAMLSACGGGGGDGGDSSPEARYEGPTAEVTVRKPAEAEALVGNVFDVIGSYSFDMATGFFMLAGEGESKKDRSALEQAVAVRDLANKYVSWQPDSRALGGRESDTYPCESGTVTESSTGTGEIGSTFSLSFNDCVDEGARINGYLHLRLIEETESSMAIAFTVKGLKFEDLYSSDYALMHGGFTLTESYAQASQHQILEEDGAALYSDVVFDGQREQTLLQNFSVRATYHEPTGEATYSNDATVTSTRIGGRVAVDTTSPFVVPGGAEYPQSGEAVVTAAGNVKIRLTAIGGDQVKLEYALDGDGVYDDGETTKPWANL